VAEKTRITGKTGLHADVIADTEGVNRVAVDADVTVDNLQLFTKPYDAITVTYPLTTQEVYQSRVGGILGVVQETVTVNYTDATKNFILNVART
jgi:hypothetical protein